MLHEWIPLSGRFKTPVPCPNPDHPQLFFLKQCRYREFALTVFCFVFVLVCSFMDRGYKLFRKEKSFLTMLAAILRLCYSLTTLEK